VRGETGPSATSGDTPTPDGHGSYGITNDDLLNNKSNIIVKINQVAAKKTVKYNKINAAKDLYNKDVNPSENTPTGKTDGAGFFIDMSRYAMIGANPSFSSLTATCQTTLSGNTFIRDGANTNSYGTDSGHTLDIKVTNNVVSGVTWDETLSAKTESISGRTTTIGNDGENLHVIGDTTEVHDGDVTITNKSNVTENTTGTTTINNTGKTTVNVVHGTEINSCEGISANTDVFIVKQCTAGGGKAQFDFCDEFAVNSDDVKITECTPDGSIVITEKIVEVNAENTTINDSGNTEINTTIDFSANTGGDVFVNTTGDTTIDRVGDVSANNQSNVTVITSGNSTTTISGDTIENHSGTTTENFNGNFSGNTSGTTTEIKIGDVEEYHSGTTTEIKKDVVTEANLSAKTENTSGTSTINIVEDNIVNVSGETHITTTGNTAIHTESKLGLTAVDDILESSEANIIITANEDICETAGENATFYGAEKTNIGLNCDDSSSSTTTNVYGAEINLSGETTDATSCEHFYINTNDFKLKQCEDSQGSAEFKFCEDFNVQSNAITLEECDSGRGTIIIKETNEIISGTNLTVNEGDDVKFNIGDDLIINTSGDTNISTTGETQIKSIENICVISNSDANFGGDINTRIGADCDGNSGYSNNTYITASLSAFTYAPTIINSGTTNNNTFVTLNTTANTINQSGDTYNVTATTEVHSTTSFTVNSAVDACINSDDVASIGGANKTNIGYDCDGEILSTETNIYGGDVNISGDTVNITGDTYITGGLCVTKGLCKKLTWSYGDVKTGGTCTDNSSTNFSADTCFTIPRCVSDINRATLTYSYGDVRDLHESSGGTYDPGENCDGVKVTDYVTIPTSMDHLAEFNGTCYTLSHDVCMENNTIVAKGFYSSSDRRLKDNISNLSREDLEKVGDIAFKSFTFANDDSKTKTYGVIAQDVQDAGLGNIVHTNSDGMLNVDYTSLLLLRIAKMEDVINDLESKIENLSNRLNFGK
jgi:hypothetical protein